MTVIILANRKQKQDCRAGPVRSSPKDTSPGNYLLLLGWVFYSVHFSMMSSSYYYESIRYLIS